MENKTRKYASLKQISALIDYMAENKDVANNRVTSAQGRLDFEGAWDRLTVKLNAMGGGAIKSTDKWKQTWRDLKSNAKKKVSKNRQNCSQTGGGPSQDIPLTDLEAKVVAILGADAVVGMNEVQEVEVQEINREDTQIISVEEKKDNNMENHELSSLPSIISPTTVGTLSSLGQAVTTTPTSWAERRQAQRQKKKRVLGSIEERVLKLEEDKLKIEREKFEFEKEYKKKKLELLERLTIAKEASLDKNKC